MPDAVARKNDGCTLLVRPESGAADDPVPHGAVEGPRESFAADAPASEGDLYEIPADAVAKVKVGEAWSLRSSVRAEPFVRNPEVARVAALAAAR